MEFRFNNGEHDISFILYPSTSLICHTANLLNCPMGGRGTRKYTLRQNIDARYAINPGFKLERGLYERTLFDIVTNRIDDPIDAINSVSGFSREFAGVLKASFDQFYSDYFRDNKKRLERNFELMVKSRNWLEVLHHMQEITGSRFDCDYNIIGTEASGAAADKIEPNISVGSPSVRASCGFVHEGFHLLLERSGEYQRVAKFMNSHRFSNPNTKSNPYLDYRGKIEQAVVIALDCLLSDRPDYLEGCHVGDLRDLIFSGIKSWYNGLRKTSLSEELMKILKENEEKVFGGRK